MVQPNPMPDITPWIITLGGVSAAALTAWKFLMPQIVEWRQAFRGMGELLATNKAVLKTTQGIAVQLAPNDGTSLRDAMTRLEIASTIRDAYSKSIWTAMEQALFKAAPDGQLTEFNRDFLSLVGRPEEELKGLGWLNIFPQSDRAPIASEWAECVRQKRFFDVQVVVNGKAYTLKAEPIMVGQELLGWSGSITEKLNGIEGKLRTIEKAVGEKS